MPDKPDRPRSRHPTSYPPEVLRAIRTATRMELCIPFQSVDLARQFRKTLADVRRSFREHGDPLWQRVNALSLTEHTTIDVMQSRPSYDVDCLRYPVTCVLSCASGFMENLSMAQSAAGDESVNPINSQLPSEALEAEVLALLANTIQDDEDDTEARVKAIFTRG